MLGTPMTSSYPVSVTTPDGPVPAVVHLPERTPAPVVVCCHGLLIYKDSSKFVAIGERFSSAGLAVVRFDFSGCGESQTIRRESLLFSRMRDLRFVLDYVQHEGWGNGTTGLLGSSLGGYLSLLAAASNPHRVQAVVCWATPFDLSRIKLALSESEELKQVFPPGFLLGSPENLNELHPVPRVLIIHGQQDETVSWHEAVAIYRRVDEPKRVLLMKTADHRLLDPHWREMAMKLSLEWFQEHGLRGSP
jgi:alpha-beta hydrolase superfamily lysophospholipase